MSNCQTGCCGGGGGGCAPPAQPSYNPGLVTSCENGVSSLLLAVSAIVRLSAQTARLSTMSHTRAGRCLLVGHPPAVVCERAYPLRLL